jgi:hypothetical protein
VGMLAVLAVDVAVVWTVLGETGRAWFSARGPATTTPGA